MWCTQLYHGCKHNNSRNIRSSIRNASGFHTFSSSSALQLSFKRYRITACPSSGIFVSWETSLLLSLEDRSKEDLNIIPKSTSTLRKGSSKEILQSSYLGTLLSRGFSLTLPSCQCYMFTMRVLGWWILNEFYKKVP